MSVICSSETLFFCTFLQIEKGVFSLPTISDTRPFSFKTSVNSLDTLLILVVLLSFISSSLFLINSLASKFNTWNERSSNSSLILFIPILSAKGAYISIVSFALRTCLSLFVTNLIVLMLCNLSASFTKRTLISFDVAKISFLKFSAFEFDIAWFSNSEILVTPSTKSATSKPNSSLIVWYVAWVSSIVSWRSPVAIVALSNFNSVKMFATATGWMIYGDPSSLFCFSWAFKAKLYALVKASGLRNLL